jgi:hypothetical protein
VPAKVAGTHTVPAGELVLKQKYQVLSGTLTADGKTYAVEGRVRGNNVTLRAGGKKYSGRMDKEVLELK